MQHRRQFKDSTDRGRCQEQYFSGFWPLQWPQRPSQAIFHQWAHLAPPRPRGVSKKPIPPTIFMPWTPRLPTSLPSRAQDGPEAPQSASERFLRPPKSTSFDIKIVKKSITCISLGSSLFIVDFWTIFGDVNDGPTS